MDLFFNILQVGLLIKLFFVALAALYLIFSAVVYRQITLMTEVLESKISPTIGLIALGQVVAAGLLMLLSLVLA